MKLRLSLLLRAALLATYSFHGLVCAEEKKIEYKDSSSPYHSQTQNSNDLKELDSYSSIYFFNNKGGVINSIGSLSFTNNSNILFEGNTVAGRHGGAISLVCPERQAQIPCSLLFEGNGLVSFAGNSASATSPPYGTGLIGGAGGAIYAGVQYPEFNASWRAFSPVFKENKELSFAGNSAALHGGAIYLASLGSTQPMFEKNGKLIFLNNTVTGAGEGGALYLKTYGGGDQAVFQGNGEIRFEGNSIRGDDSLTYRGGAIYADEYIRFLNNGSLTFLNNTAGGTMSYCGGIYVRGGIEIVGTTGEVLFQGNTAGRSAGALASAYWFQIEKNKAVNFIGNKTLGGGAAVYLTMDHHAGVTTYLLSADYGDITFKDNLQNVGEADQSRMGFVATVNTGANNGALRFDMKAQEGRSIFFYDALYFTRFDDGNGADSSGKTGVTVDLNNNANENNNAKGNIVLSGKYNEGTVLDSYIAGNTNLYGGCLSIVDRARLSMRDVWSTGYGWGHILKDTYFDFYAHRQTVLEMRRGGAMVAGTVKFEGPWVTLRTGSGASLTATSVDMQYGVTFDIAPFLDPNVEGSGLTVKTASWTIGGNLLLSNNLDFNADTRWSSNQSYLLMTDLDGTRGEKDFKQIAIAGIGSSIGEGYAYQGEWTFSWDNNQLYAHWIVKPFEGAELWWDGNGAGSGDGLGIWDQTAANKVWNKDSFTGLDWAFQDMDKVHFTRSGDVLIQGLVSVNGQVKPSGIIEVAFNAGNGDLIWHGDGSIVGNATIEKFGTGKLVIRTENAFTGGTKLHGGTIRVDTKTGLGTGDVTIHGGLLDLGEQGVENSVTVVGKGALAGIADGKVVVKAGAELNFLADTWFRGSSTDTGLETNPVNVEGNGMVNIQAGTDFSGHINLGDLESAVNFVAGNGGESIFSGSISGNGSINVHSGKHLVSDKFLHGVDDFTGTLTILGGQMTIASPRRFTGAVNLLGGTFLAGAEVEIGTVTVGNDTNDKVIARIGVTPVGDISKDYLWANTLDVKKNATLQVIGRLNVNAQTTVHSGGMIEMQNGATLSTQGLLTSLNEDASLPSGGVLINESCTWNANGGFEVHHVDARTGTLTIGSNSVIKENGYFYAENTVYGTDKDGNILAAGTAADNLPTLTIQKGATFWAGNTVKHAQVDAEKDWYQTITGFHNVTLDIDALARIGTFVIKGDGDGKVSHAAIVESMKRAFVPKLEDGVDLRTYLYVLRAGTEYSSDSTVILSNEEVHVEGGALANVGETSGAVVNLGGELKVDRINDTGSVTASGGYSDLLAATSDKDQPMIMGSFGAASNTKETAGQIKLDENSTNHSFVVVDTVQAETGAQTVIGSASNVNAQNFIVSGADTLLNNQGGALVVEKEVTLSEEASYSAGNKDRFGWVNMQKGNLSLTGSSWNAVTLGSYGDGSTSDSTAAKVRLDESKSNNLDANELHVMGEGEQTNVTAGSTVSANKLIVGKDSHLDVQADGTVIVREHLFFEADVAQSGTVLLGNGGVSTLEHHEGDNTPPKDVVVSFSGNNHVGVMDSASSSTFVNQGFNQVDGYNSQGADTWVFVVTDEMLANQDVSNAFAKILDQAGSELKNITLDTSQLTQSYMGDIQLYSDNITLTSKDVDYGEATGLYNQKDAIKNFVFVNPVIEELQNSVINSLWTITDAMDSFSSAISGQLGLGSYRQTPQRHLWGKAFYLNENVGKALKGYRKNSGGYAIGYDDAVSDDSILGGALGQTFGSEQTNRGLGKTHQDIVMGMLYGRTALHKCEHGFVALDYMAGYGNGRNRGKFNRNGNSSTGRWNSDTYNAEANLTWYRKVGKDMSINPYVGLEFILSEHNAHMITGGAGDFAVSRSRMHALRLPIGATFEHTTQLKNKSSLTNYIGASYVPDLVRRNPKATVVNGKTSFTMHDANVGRNAIRAYIGSSWQLDEQWNVNVHYEVDAASQKVNQTGRLGTSYSF